MDLYVTLADPGVSLVCMLLLQVVDAGCRCAEGCECEVCDCPYCSEDYDNCHVEVYGEYEEEFGELLRGSG